MSGESKNKALMTGTVIYAIGNFGTKILSFLIVPLYTFFILPSDLGNYDLLITTVSLLSPLVTLRISEATYRWMIQRLEPEDKCISATFSLLIRNCIILFILVETINFFVPIWNCQYFVFILIFDRVLECVQKLLRGFGNQKLFALSGVLYTGIFVFLNLFKICYLHEGVEALFQSMMTSQVIVITFIFIFEKRMRCFSFSKSDVELRSKMLKYSAPLVPSSMSWWVMGASDRYVIRFFLDSSANGIYAVSCKFPSILSTIFVMFNNAWTDLALARLKSGSDSEEYTRSVFRTVYKISFGFVLFLIPFTKVLTSFILGPAYKSAASYIGFLYLGTIFQGFSAFCSVGYLQGDKTGGAAKSSLYGAIANLVINLLLIRYVGLYAAGISTFVGFFVMWIFRMKDIRDKFPVKINIYEFVAYLTFAVLIAALCIWSNLFIDLILSCIAGVTFVILNRTLLIKCLNTVLDKIKK